MTLMNRIRRATARLALTLTVMLLGIAPGAGCGGDDMTLPAASSTLVGVMKMRSSDTLSPSADPGQPMRQTLIAAGTGAIGQATLLSIGLGGLDLTAPDAVAAAADGSAWFTTYGHLIRVGADGAVALFDLPRGLGFAPSIVADRHGLLWLAVWDPAPGLARLDPATNQIVSYDLPDPLARPTAITASRISDDIYVTGGNSPVVGRVDGQGQVFLIASESSRAPITITAAGVAVTDAGTVYVSDYDRGRIGRVAAGGFDWIDLGGDTQAPSGLAAKGDGSISFVSLGRPKVAGMIDAAGITSQFDLDVRAGASDKSVSQNVLGPDGAFWFTMPEDSRIGRLASDGTLSYLDIAPAALPRGLAFGTDGRLWVTIVGPGLMARIDLGR